MRHAFPSLVGGLEHFLFSHILGIIIPIDFHRVQATNQMFIWNCKIRICHPLVGSGSWVRSLPWIASSFFCLHPTIIVHSLHFCSVFVGCSPQYLQDLILEVQNTWWDMILHDLTTFIVTQKDRQSICYISSKLSIRRIRMFYLLGLRPSHVYARFFEHKDVPSLARGGSSRELGEEALQMVDNHIYCNLYMPPDRIMEMKKG